MFGSREKVGIYLQATKRKDWIRKPVCSRKTRYGFRIFLNPTDMDDVSSAIGASGIYEMDVSELLRSLVKPRSTVIDVGANIGWFTLLAAKLGASKIVAFEPDSNNLRLLRQSMMANGFRNIICYDFCVTSHEGYVSLFVVDNMCGLNSIIRRSPATSGEIHAKSTTLDTIVREQEIQEIDVLKIDVEGAEAEVISGGTEALTVTKSIVMEWNRETWSSQIELFKRLCNQFEVYEIIKSPRLIRRATPEVLFGKNPPLNVYLARHGP
jgi:FkbM family methyltransferase